MPLTRYWVYEPDALCSRPLPNADDLEPAQVYLAADVERVVGELRGRVRCSCGAYHDEIEQLKQAKAALAAKERELSERMADYTAWTLGFNTQLAAKERELTTAWDCADDHKKRAEALGKQLAAQSASLAQLQARVKELGGA